MNLYLNFQASQDSVKVASWSHERKVPSSNPPLAEVFQNFIQLFLLIERRLSSAKPLVLVLLRDGRTLGTERKTFRSSPRRLGDEQKTFCSVPRVLPSSKMATIGKNLIPQ